MNGIHLKDRQYCWPACGAVHQEILLVEDVAQVTCGACKRTVQYKEGQRDRLLALSPEEFANEVLAAAVRMALAKIAGTPLYPSEEQVSTFDVLIGMTVEAPANHHASVRGEMDEDGTLLVTLIEDEARQMARFGRDGRLLGDWF